LVFKIRKILEVLGDGKWHSIPVLAEKVKLASSEVKARLDFLNKFELAEIDPNGRVKINEDFKELPELSTI